VTWLVHRLLTLRGWRFLGVLPDDPKMIIIGAPHTTNWDFLLFMGALRAYRMKVRFVGKDGLFRWPFGYFFRALGGIPVSRSRPGGVVGQVVREFEEADRMILVIAPEGTRRAAPTWKSGFIHIARGAGVPVVPASVDFTSREVELGAAIPVTDDIVGFMDQLRVFYEGKRGLLSQGIGPITVAEEG